MSPPQISIIGAGISGLVLGRCLLRRGIPFVLYDKDEARTGASRHNYGITLHPWAYGPLLSYLDLNEESFRNQLGVDSAVGGAGNLKKGSDVSSFRANRRKLETLLREGLDVKWGHTVSGIEAGGPSTILGFHNGRRVESSTVVGADGVHSETRKIISPVADMKILPFVVYNGKRRVNRETFREIYSPYMDGSNVIEQMDGQALLQISLNDITHESVSISYTYSRPSRQSDPLFSPGRSKSGAQDIPAQLFQEIEALDVNEMPFKDVFDVEKMKEDRLLNWLMRSVQLDRSQLTTMADAGVVLLGDAVHGQPILGGNGANAAICDGMALADFLAEHGARNLAKFYEQTREAWRTGVEESERQLAEMHNESASKL